MTHGFDRAAGPSPKTDSPAFKVEKRANNNRVIGFAVTLGNRDRQSPMPRRCPLEGDSVMRQGTAASFIIQHLPRRNCNSRVILDLPIGRRRAFPALAPVFAAVHSGAVQNRPCRRAYDHRRRDLICEGGDPVLFPRLGILRSTAASWIRRGSRDIVTTELFAEDELAPRARV